MRCVVLGLVLLAACEVAPAESPEPALIAAAWQGFGTSLGTPKVEWMAPDPEKCPARAADCRTPYWGYDFQTGFSHCLCGQSFADGSDPTDSGLVQVARHETDALADTALAHELGHLAGRVLLSDSDAPHAGPMFAVGGPVEHARNLLAGH